MNVTINGKIVKELPQKSGIGRNGGEWISKDFVIETEDGSTIAFSVFGTSLAMSTEALYDLGSYYIPKLISNL